MKTEKKISVCIGALAALLIVALLCPMIFLIHEADHHCEGEGCEICEQIALCAGALRAFGGLARVFCVGILLAGGVLSLGFAFEKLRFATPISRKVKLLN